MIGTILALALLNCPAPYAAAGMLEVHFTTASAALPDRDRQAIADLARHAGDLPGIEFSVNSYTDQGTFDHPSTRDFSLSKARLEAMIHVLNQNGVKPEDIGGTAFNYARDATEQVFPDGQSERKAGTIRARTRTDCHPLEARQSAAF